MKIGVAPQPPSTRAEPEGGMSMAATGPGDATEITPVLDGVAAP
jgi:hypothetical protein